MLALGWRQYSTQGFSVNGKTLEIKETSNDPRGTGLIAWDGSFVLAKFLEKRFGSDGLDGKFVLELGAGVGLVGIAAHLLGAELVCLTDLDYALDNLRFNLDSNSCPDSVFCVELDWTKHESSDYKELFHGSFPDVIGMADVAWVVEYVPPLVEQLTSICKFCQSHQVRLPVVLLAHQTRSTRTDDILFSMLRDRGFVIRKVEQEEYFRGFDAVPVYEISFSSSF